MTSVVNKRSFITLANQITILRILLIPPIVIALLKNQILWVVVLLSFCMLTDFLDGLAARVRGEPTKLGAVLDPMADKLLMTSVYIVLTVQGFLDVWIFVVIFSRDLLIVMGWLLIFILTGSSQIKPRVLGKITTASQMITALACILLVPEAVHRPLIWITVALTIASAVDYVIVGEKRLGQWG